ncbi:PREDICTED: disease resistance protein RPM1-like [Lupinus angustifolius]|uniref:disease resistance protein RPM1-like n=1 Tax=Lupinus angustifolius TaxID=3871 RepID=UPI00092F6E46|nr:PREDICTED: disease resistance protein RPM1-like [Lupinus angustifolius]
MCDQVAKFFPQLVDVWKLLRSIPKEIAQINEELESIQISINAVDRMAAASKQENIDDNGMKRKLRHIREETLRIKEVTEDYRSIQQQQPPSDLGCIAVLYATANFIKTMIPRLRISYEIQDIKSSIHEINEISCFEQGSSSGSQAPQHALRRKALYVKEDDVVGFEVPRDNLIGWLKEEREERSVIAVVGMGGQGKTTLAKIVYKKVIGDFDCHAWITVSQDYTAQKLLRAMLEKLDENEKGVSEMDLESLTKKVRKCLRQKRYVFFFDDVNQSRIVITTRIMNVVQLCRASSLVHILNLQPLLPQQSWELFYKKAFRNEPDGLCPTGLEDISSKIVEKCEGLPLAIVAIGSLLASKEKNSHKWQRLFQHVINELDKYPNSIGITNILGLSYDVLPYYLKSCFLYFGIYPKDYEVNSQRLIRLWIAEEFIKFDEKLETLEEVGEQYLEELVQRNLVQTSSFSVDGKPKSYRVHGLLHDMILMKIKVLGFCHFISDNKVVRSMSNERIQRLQIKTNFKNDDLKGANNEASSITSIHIFGNEGLSEKEFAEMIPTKYRRLKVFEYDWIDRIPLDLGCLIHLRYLRFTGVVEFLPDSIGNLYNLETLDLKWTNVLELPSEIKKLTKLRHLLLPCSNIMIGIRGFESLQTLYCVDTWRWDEHQLIELGHLKQLRSLGLMNFQGRHYKYYHKYVTCLCYSINKMEYLENLYIHSTKRCIYWDIPPLPILQRLKLVGELDKFSEWIPKHKNLVRLSLRFSKLNDDPMKSLQHLPNLLSLHLWDAYDGIYIEFVSGMFQKLKNLELIRLKSLTYIYIGEGALPSLKHLTLQDIPNLEKVAYGMNNLHNLETLWIKEMPKEFVDRVRGNVWIHNNVGTGLQHIHADRAENSYSYI